MVAPDREHAISAEQIEVAISVRVDQVRSLSTHPHLVEAERPQNPPHLRVQETVVERHLLAGAGAQDLSHRGRGRAGHELSLRSAAIVAARELARSWLRLHRSPSGAPG